MIIHIRDQIQGSGPGFGRLDNLHFPKNGSLAIWSFKEKGPKMAEIGFETFLEPCKPKNFRAAAFAL